MDGDISLKPPDYLLRCDYNEAIAAATLIVCKTVAVPNKDRLFQRALARSTTESQGPIIESILRRLQRLDPEVSRHFRLKASDRVDAPLRLLTECTEGRDHLQPQRFDSYIALSYCWHSSAWTPVLGCEAYSDPRHPDWQWPISKRMFQALLDMRHSRNEGIWIDAICINQTDPHEKMIAIEAMNVIYRSARLVVVVLEDVRISSYEEAILRECATKGQWASNFRAATANEWLPAEDQMRPLAATLIRILSARWFGRAFCSQEMQLAKASIFVVSGPNQCLTVHRFTLEWIHYVTRHYVQRHEDLFDRMSEVAMSYDILTRAGDDYADYKTQTTLSRPYLSMFRDLMLLGCSEVRDKLSIALNLSLSELSYHGDVEDINRCRWILAMFALAAGDATVLCGRGDLIHSRSGFATSPWLQWPGDHDSISMIPELHPRLLDGDQSTTIQNGHLCLDLLVFTSRVPQLPTSESCTKASNFLKCCMAEHAEVLKGLDPVWLGLETIPFSTEFNDHLSVCRDILATSLECGIHWMASVVDQTSVIASMSSEAKTVNGLWDAVRMHLFTDTTLNGLLGHELRNFQHNCSHFIAFVFRRTLESFLDAGHVARLMTGPLQQSGITPLIDTDQLTLAVPAALAGSEFSTVRRLWYLKPAGRPQDRLWQIVKKEMLFGCPSLIADGECIQYKPFQRFCG